MKLTALKSAIRTAAEPPRVAFTLPGGQRLTVLIQKTPLLASLDELFPNKTDETGIFLREDFYLQREGERDGS